MTETSEHAGPQANARTGIPLNVHSAEYCRDIYAIYDDLRGKCPVAWSTENGGFWALTDYASTFEATRDDALFTSTPGTGIPETADTPTESLSSVMPPIHTDPPLTADMRKVTIRHLSPAAAEAAREQIRQIATEQIDTFIELGEGDLVQQLTTPLPARVILRLLNFDESRWPEWVTMIHTMIHGAEGGGDVSSVQAELGAAIMGELGRRAELGTPDDDMVGAILSGQAGGRPLTDEEKFGYILLLLFGGMDTTSGLTGNTLVQLSRRPELKQQLIDRPDLMPRATEEFLRHGTPTQGLGRTVSRDCEWRGQQLRKGDRALLLWAAANRDPEIFDDPGTVDLERYPNRHMAFGVGMHRCLGSNLARVMFEVMITEILRRLPDFTVVEEGFRRFDNASAVYAPSALPVRFTPGPASGAAGRTA